MPQLCVPARDPLAHWPTLGPQICDWIEANLVYGPGDINGQPAVVSDEVRGLIYSMYEVHPKGSPRAGRRRFHRASVSLRKGLAKTELGAWITCAELAEDAPVRCDGFDADGEPVGVSVAEPFIPLLAVTEDQSEGLLYAAVRAILLEGPLADDFETGKLFVTRKDGRGRCEAVAAAPSTDGGKTTFEVYDEEQHLKLERHRKAHQTMQLNLTKLFAADPWSLGLGTAPVPGEGSVAEGTWEYAEEIAAGKRKDATMFFFGRWAGDEHDLSTREDVEAAVLEATGTGAAAWSNIDAQVDAYYDPQTDIAMWEGRILNRKVQATRQVFNLALIRELVEPLPGRIPPRKTPITIGFDGSRTDDATGLVGTVIDTGYQFEIAVWERPEGEEGWEVPYKEVEEAIEDAMDRWRVVLGFFDPPYWEGLVDACHGKWPDKIIKFHTNQHKKMAYVLKAYVGAIKAREVTFDGHKDLLRHMGNARKRELNISSDDDEGGKLYVMVKERKGSPLKIDLAMAATLSWQARLSAIGGGALTKYGSKPGRTTVSI